MEKDIRFLVTNKCNYNCVFCHNEGQEKVIPDKELDVEDYLFLFKMFKKTTGYSGVTISGGEPFTFRNIDNLLKVLFEEGAKITVVTNGALLDRHFEALKYVKRINVSIHSLDAKNYDAITQTTDKLGHVQDNLKYVAEHFKNLEIRLNATPCKNSGWMHNSLEGLIEYSKTIGASLKLTELFPSSDENCIRKMDLIKNLEELGYKFVAYENRVSHYKNEEHSVYITQCTCAKAVEFKNSKEYCFCTRDYYVNHDGFVQICMYGDSKDYYNEIKNRDEEKIIDYFENCSLMISEKKCKLYLETNLKSEKERLFMKKEEIVEKIAKDIKEKSAQEGSGHDWWHIKRVYDLALTINEKENKDEFVIKMIALMHDLFDDKFAEGDTAENLKNYMTEQEVIEFIEPEDLENILHSIKYLGFKGGFNKEKISEEGQIVQDADRIDAIGAIGIARCFTYGGKKGLLIYDPDMGIIEMESEEQYRSNKKHSINHFYEKLLKLKDTMNTEGGRAVAEGRTVYMENFLEQFYAEWEGKR